MDKNNVDTILSSGFIVNLNCDEGSKVACIIWGTVLEDHTHGWRCGDYACTTEIIRRDGLFFYTKNSAYKLAKEPQCIDVPFTFLEALRSGVNPQILLFKEETGGELSIFEGDKDP